MHHVGGDVALLPRTPRIADARRFFDHDAAVFANALPVKGWLCRHSLGTMSRPLSGNHALAEQHLRALHRAFLDEVVVLHHQHFADVLRMIQKNNMMRTDLVVRNIAVSLGEMLKKKNGIRGSELAQGKPQKITLEA